jgi:NAD-dependent histone deacetylase SIR2
MRPTPPTSDTDGPARKKRKLGDPKERTTERLDLTRDNVENDPQLRRVLDVLQKKRKIVVIAGAGISVSAGIPDFRSSKTGLFDSLRKKHQLKSSGKDLFDASVYQDDAATSHFHDMVRSLSQQTKDAQPTPFHHLLATLAHEGRLLRLYTQNVDGIDTSLPPLRTQVPLPKKGPWPKTVQLHGGLDHMICSKCQTLSDFDAEQFKGPVPPACPHCTENDQVRQVAEKRSHGIGRLRPRMVLYNEHNPDDEAIGSCASLDLRTRPDAVIVVGTTLKVPGVRRIVREMCAVVRDRRDGVTIWINNDPEPVSKDLANCWDIVVKGPCDEVARHAAMPKWNDPTTFKVVTDEELRKAKQNDPVVMVPVSTPKKNSQISHVQMLTPAASPRMGPQTISKEDSSTPSKTSGRKRKAPGQPAAAQTKAKTTAKRQPAKKTASKKKAATSGQTMTNLFKVAKSSANRKAPAAAKKDTAFNQFSVKQGLHEPSKPVKGIDLDDTVTLAPALVQALNAAPATPRRRSFRFTKWKNDPMTDVSYADARINGYGSPPRPTMEPFSSQPSTPYYTPPSGKLEEYETPEEARPSSSSSHKSDTIVPNSYPRNLGFLLDMTG